MSDAQTPPPRLILDEESPSTQMRISHECPYRDEILALRRLLSLGAEEQAMLGRRRDRVGSWLGGAALAAVLTLMGWLYVEGQSSATIDARREVRIEVLERSAAGSAPAAAQLARVEQRLEGLEQRLGDRLTGIERRLDRAESASAGARRDNR